jgi:hypothetical protein
MAHSFLKKHKIYFMAKKTLRLKLNLLDFNSIFGVADILLLSIAIAALCMGLGLGVE